MTNDNEQTHRPFLSRHFPSLSASLLLFALILVIRPFSELPLNDDWQYAHFAKTLAERGNFPTDVSIAPTVVGQSLMAWPIIQVFGFSHLALRLLTLALSLLLLFELDYLMLIGAASARVRLVALCTVVANPLFLYLSTTFMTENYAYVVALLAACIWFRRRGRSSIDGVIAALLGGFAFWIRQFGALVVPALVLAEWIAGGASLTTARSIIARRAVPIVVWAAVVAAYFPWARATGHYAPQFAEHLTQALIPSPVPILFQSGIFLFYLTFFLAPFIISYGVPAKPTVVSSLVLCVLALTAALAWMGGIRNGPPSATLNASFPFLNNVFTSSGIGPVTLTDVYWGSGVERPRALPAIWLALEGVTLFVSLGWASFVARMKEERNVIGIFGVCLALLSLFATVLSYRDEIFDRYHYAGILGLTLAVAAYFPRGRERRLVRAAVVWSGAMAIFSTLSLHDYFRWNEARAALLAQAQQRGIALAAIDAGFEPNGWNAIEAHAVSPGCGPEVGWFCRNRRYRIGLEPAPSDRVVISQPANTWLFRFPDLELSERQ